MSVVLTAGVVYLAYVVTTLPAFHLSSIDVEIDGIAVSKRDVLAAADIDPNANVWLLDMRRIQARIQALPYVAGAAIARAFPAQIAIAVTEREPAACVRSGTRVVTIDRYRRILQNGCARRDAFEIDLGSGPLGAPGAFAGDAELVTLLDDARSLEVAGLRLRSIGEDRFGQLVAADAAGIVLLFGTDSDLADKAKLVAPVLAAARPGRTIRAIDLRAPATPTVEFR